MRSMNRKENKKIAVMAAVIMGVMMFAFMPLASAEVTSFAVTPSTGLAGAVDSYNVLVTTTGVKTLNISIPAGFLAVTPMTGGVEIARGDFWNTTGTRDYYGHGTVTANNTNPSEKVDVYCKMRVGGEEVEFTRTESVNYNAGDTTTLVVEWPLEGAPIGTAKVNITLPTKTDNGCINITIICFSLDLLEDVHIAIKQFVRNPLVANVYNFYADGEVAPVNIHRQPLGDITYLKKGPYSDRDYDLYIYTAPTTIGQQGAYTASDYWSPDGDTRAITAIGGGDEIAYLEKGAYGVTDYDLYIYTAPTTIGEHGTLIASDYWSPDGQTKGISALW